MSIVRTDGLNKRVNSFWKIFASIEGIVKGNEELINGKSVQQNMKLILSLMQKFNLLFYEITGCFYQQFYQNKFKAI